METTLGSGVIHSTPLVNALNDVFCNYTPSGLLVNFPINHLVECHQANAQSLHPDATGWPQSTTNCSDQTIVIDFIDTETIGNCDNEYAINREWTVQDNCGNNESFIQTISIYDNTPPEVSCGSHSITESSDEPVLLNEDFSGYYDPTDNCSENITIIQEPSNGTELGIGSHEILVKFYDECGNWSECSIQYIVQPYTSAGIEELEIGFRIYPNPTRELFKVSASSSLEKVTILNLLGQVVEEHTNLSDNELIIQSAGWESGIYLVRVNTVGQEFVERLIVH